MSYDPDDYGPEDLLDEELPKPPEDMKLSIEVSLTEYSPNGLLELIARGLLTQIGGKDRWKARLEKHLLELGRAKAEGIVNETIRQHLAGAVNGMAPQLADLVQLTVLEWAGQKVNSKGEADGGYRAEMKTRAEWMVKKVVQESIDAAFKQAEAEWRASTAQAIKETLSSVLADRLARALPAPPEFKVAP